MSSATDVRPDVSIVVPAYNEARRIASTLCAVRAHLDARRLSGEIIVVADGDDGTRERVSELALEDARLSVLGGPGRHGKGRGVRLGVERARGRIVGFVDADDKTPIEELDRLLPWFEQGYDVVIGSRGQSESSIEVAQPWHRRLGSRGFAFLMHVVTGLWQLSDTQCGFKFFRAEAAHDLFARQRIDGYMFDFREIGTMKCLGALDRFVLRLFILEAGMQGLAGAAAGALIGTLFALVGGLARFGLAAVQLVAVADVAASLAGATGIGLLLSLLGVLYPAWVAARMQPVEAMRVEQ